VDAETPVTRLDELDARIVAALQVDARATWGQLASVVDVSETTVLRRVQRLRERGDLVIVGVPNPLRCGLGQPVLVQLRTSPGSTARVARGLAERPDVRFVAQVTGGRDIICEVIVPHRSDLTRFLFQEVGELGDVLSTTTEVVLKTFKTRDQWSQELLAGAAVPQSVPQSVPASRRTPDAKARKIDDMDTALLAALAEDGRRSFVDLSHDLGLSETAVSRRLAALVAGSALSFSTLVAPPALGFELEVFLHLRVELSAIDSVAEVLAARPEVRYASATAGNSDLICEAVLRDNDALYTFLTDTLGRLKGVRDVDVDIELETIKRASRYPLFRRPPAGTAAPTSRRENGGGAKQAPASTSDS
jgi:DNA-binding Lrp family transcriptional regulator